MVLLSSPSLSRPDGDGRHVPRIEFRIMTEDPVLVEGKTSRRLQIGSYARAGSNAAVQTVMRDKRGSSRATASGKA